MAKKKKKWKRTKIREKLSILSGSGGKKKKRKHGIHLVTSSHQCSTSAKGSLALKKISREKDSKN